MIIAIIVCFLIFSFETPSNYNSAFFLLQLPSKNINL
jgi:hypothetical protein